MVRDSSVDYIVQAIAKQARLQVVYDMDNPVFKKRVSVRVIKMSVTAAFVEVLKGTDLTATLASNGETVIIRPASAGQKAKVAEKNGTIIGQVLDSVTKVGIPGATVVITALKLSVLSDASGIFNLRSVPAGTHVVTFKMLGYTTVSRTITVADSQLVDMNVFMKASVTMLSDVVTTATGKQKRIEIGNDFSTINVDSVLRVSPISSVTDLLETRVPGLTVLRSAGTPGAPARIRLRGASSLTQSNDPIVIVDGVRISADLSQEQQGLQVSTGPATSNFNRDKVYPTPSPLDQLDPNSIATIDVFKGPSATAMYGSDAANGVIVITTKRGRLGPTRWTVTGSQGTASIPGKYPVGMFQFYDSRSVPSLNPNLEYETLDSLVPFQALNHPRYTVFGRGGASQLSTTVSGGSGTLDYSMTASVTAEKGVFRMPQVEAERFLKFRGVDAPYWMRNPDRYGTWSLMSALGSQFNPDLRVTLSTILFRSAQRQSTLNTAIAQLMSQYIDPSTLAAKPIVTDINDRLQMNQLRLAPTGQINWQPFAWLPLTTQLGIDVSSRDSKTFHLSNLPYSTPDDTISRATAGNGKDIVKSLNIYSVIPVGPWTTLSWGVNGVNRMTENFSSSPDNAVIPPGLTEPSTYGKTTRTSNASNTFGWFAEPRFNIASRLFIQPGFRLDNNSLSGNNAQYSPFPKVNLSWLASEEPWFPSGTTVTLFRPRFAYGYAGVQPGVNDRLRLLDAQSLCTPGASPTISCPQGSQGVILTTLGNTKIRPERSTELEMGFDTELWSNRMSLSFTQYRKVRRDAIVEMPVAPSIYGENQSIRQNLGIVRNTGVEMSVQAQLIESAAFGWSVGGNFSRRTNVLVKINDDAVQSFGTTSLTRFVEGYPLFGRWARPLVGYTDMNQDGNLDYTELRYADSAVYLGTQEPNYNLVFNTSASMLQGRISINASVAYEDGLTQMLSAGDSYFISGLYDNKIARQAASYAFARLVGIGGGVQHDRSLRAQTVNTLRFNSLSVNYRVPLQVAQFFRGKNMTIAVQGSNIGLHTNYRGKDPNVNATPYGNTIDDTGILPQPRTWALRFNIGN